MLNTEILFLLLLLHSLAGLIWLKFILKRSVWNKILKDFNLKNYYVAWQRIIEYKGQMRISV